MKSWRHFDGMTAVQHACCIAED